MAAASAGAALSEKLFDKAVNSALGKVNTGIVKLTEHQLKALNSFLCGKLKIRLFACLLTMANQLSINFALLL